MNRSVSRILVALLHHRRCKSLHKKGPPSSASANCSRVVGTLICLRKRRRKGDPVQERTPWRSNPRFGEAHYKLAGALGRPRRGACGGEGIHQGCGPAAQDPKVHSNAARMPCSRARSPRAMRLEKVIAKNPNNTEALILMATPWPA